MSATPSERLDGLGKALAAFLRWRADGAAGPPEALLAQHADLREFLEPMLLRDAGEADEGAAAPTLDDFRLVRELGRGGMGVVYLAEQVSLGRRVALKLLPAQMNLLPAAVARFRREATTAARLSHPGIVRMLGVGTEGETHWFAMELIDGAPLDKVIEWLRQQPPATLDAGSVARAVAACRLDTGPEAAAAAPGDAQTARSHLERVVAIVVQVADALDHAHRAGIVHRDVKPSNIVLRTDGSAVLTDFGLAREAALPAVTQTGTFAGTPYYVSPEQAGGRSTDLRPGSDVFSLGITLYELLTLRRPFAGDTTHEVLQRILSAEPVDPQRLNPGLAPDLAAIVLKALEKDPSRRYASAADLATDLRAFLAYRPVSARRATTAVRLRRWIRREPLKAVLAGGILLAVPVAAALTGFWVARAPLVDEGRRKRAADAIERDLNDGFFALELADQARAQDAFARVLQADPDDLEAIAGTTFALVQRYDIDGAMRLIGSSHALAGNARLRARLSDFVRRHAARREMLRDDPRLEAPQGRIELFVAGSIELSRAVRLRDRNTTEAAWGLLDRAIRCTPVARPRYHFHAAVAASLTRNPDRARSIAESLLGLWPEKAAAWFYAGTCLESTKDASDRKRAIAAFRRTLELEPRFPRVHHELATALGNDGDWPAAFASFRAELEINPKNADTLSHLGRALAFTGKAAQGLAPAREAVALDATDPVKLLNLAFVLENNRDAGEAIAVCRRALEIAPEFRGALEALGRLLAPRWKDGECERVWLRVLALEPANPKALSALGWLRDQGGQVEEAIGFYRRQMAVDPDNRSMLINLGTCLIRTGDASQGKELLHRALELEPGHPIAHRSLLRQLAVENDLPAVRQELERWTRVQPQDPGGWSELAMLLVDHEAGALQDTAAALAAATRAAELSQRSDPAILRTLAETQHATGNSAGAIATLEAALRLSSEKGPDAGNLRNELRAALRRVRAQAGQPQEGPTSRGDRGPR